MSKRWRVVGENVQGFEFVVEADNYDDALNVAINRDPLPYVVWQDTYSDVEELEDE